MVKRISVICMLSLFILFIFASGAFAAKSSRNLLQPLHVDGAAEPEVKYSGPSPLGYELGMQPDCEDINPALPYAEYVLQHNQWGSTYYDYQKNGSMGRMIAVSAIGEKSMVFHDMDGYPYQSPNYRWMAYNCKDPASAWCGPFKVDGGANNNAGYGNIVLLHNGRSVIVYHSTAETPERHSKLAVSEPGTQCICYFTKKYDLPDLHDFPMTTTDPNGYWPKACVVYDAVKDTNFIHIVLNENNPDAGGDQTFAYERCKFKGDTLICRSPGYGPYVRMPNLPYILPEPIAVVDTVKCITPIVVSSPVSKKVAIVYTHHREDTQINNDIFYIESTNNGDDWLGGTWPPTKINVTQYAPLWTERAYTDVAACYDYNDNLHIVWNSCYYDSVLASANNDVNLMHWTSTKPTGFSNANVIAPGYWDTGTDPNPGAWNRNISKMSISAKDPVYHPDSVYLFVTWTQFNLGDLSAANWTNGDIYGAVSHDSGRTWTPGYNLTGTNTAGCSPPNCLSEHWSSLAENMYGGDLHIEYVCDRDAGGMVQETNGAWTDNPMMYLHFKQLKDTSACGVAYSFVDPASFYDPPIKVLQGGTRVITLQLKGIYNIPGDYQVTDNHARVTCIANCSGTLEPGDIRDVSLQIDCPSTPPQFVAAVCTVKVCVGTDDEKTLIVPIHAVCTNLDYYECMRDSRTQIWKSNQVCSLWVCCNTEQKVWDYRVLDTNDDPVQSIYSSGIIVATTQGTDTVVGRQGFGQTFTYTRDTLQVFNGNMQKYFPTEPCTLQLVRCTKTFVCANNLQPPNHLKWWWMAINKHIMMFHGPTCPEFKKEQIIKYVWITYGGLPAWWPDQTPFSSYGDIYVGLFSDIDAPSDTGCNSCNTAGYDYDREIMWQHGRNVSTHPEYELYYVGLALTDTLGGIVEPLGAQSVLNQEYIYPQSGWVTGELYELAATSGVNIHYPDSVDDRTAVLTADKVNAGTDPNALDAEYILIEALIPTGLTALQAHIDDTRDIIIPELNTLGMFKRKVNVCGDANDDGTVNIADVVYIVTYLFQNGPKPKGPIWAGDANGDGVVNIADVVYIVTYLFQNGPKPNCAGFGKKV